MTGGNHPWHIKPLNHTLFWYIAVLNSGVIRIFWTQLFNVYIHGFLYCPWFFVLFPYWIANLGHRWRHPRHITHLSFTQTGFPSVIRIAFTGHFFSHRPHPTQLSSTLKFAVLRALLWSRIFAIRFAPCSYKSGTACPTRYWAWTQHLVQEHPPPKGSGFSWAFINWIILFYNLSDLPEVPHNNL